MSRFPPLSLSRSLSPPLGFKSTPPPSWKWDMCHTIREQLMGSGSHAAPPRSSSPPRLDIDFGTCPGGAQCGTVRTQGPQRPQQLKLGGVGSEKEREKKRAHC
eukprot:6846286-Pyramimonas_sp.AAC.1